MGINPGSPGYSMPPAGDDGVRSQRDIERQAREDAAARTAEATTIGKGGIRVKDGGSITVEAPGTIDLQGGAFAAATLSATSTITAGSTISTPGTVQGGAVNSTGNMAAVHMTASGRVTSADALRSPGSRSFNMTSGWAGAWINFDGTVGISTSSERFKENIEPLDKQHLADALYQAVPVSYTRIDGDATELGFIAERFVEIGLGAFVFCDADGQIEGIHYDRISIALVAVVQSQREQMLAMELRLAALENPTA